MIAQPLGVGIIGCGLIGWKRANSLGTGGHLEACTDLDSGKTEKLAGDHCCEAVRDWEILLERKNIDLVIVATLHDSLAEITQAAIESDKHVLVKNRLPGLQVSSDP